MMPMSPKQGMERSAYNRMGVMLDGKQDQGQAGYRQAEDQAQSCATCARFQPPDACAVVAGKIAPEATCDAWASGEENPEPPGNEEME